MEDVSKGGPALPGYVAMLEEERNIARAKLQRASDLLYRAESFLLGFEDDDTQEGVKELLRAIREEADITVTFATTDQRDRAYSAWAAPNVEFDLPVRVSQSDYGFWALGWLWVDDEEVNDD